MVLAVLPPRGLRFPAQRGYCDLCAIEDTRARNNLTSPPPWNGPKTERESGNRCGNRRGRQTAAGGATPAKLGGP